VRLIAFHRTAFEDYTDWARTDKKLFERIRRMIVETTKTPFEGIGKPEPLKNELKGYWSRCLSDEHRLVYKVTDEYLIVLQISLLVVSCVGS
jgi:toxin YoeB